jgi:hypothetical protein
MKQQSAAAAAAGILLLLAALAGGGWLAMHELCRARRARLDELVAAAHAGKVEWSMAVSLANERHTWLARLWPPYGRAVERAQEEVTSGFFSWRGTDHDKEPDGVLDYAPPPPDAHVR